MSKTSARTNTLSPSEKFILLAQTGIPLLLKGMPGEGKTAYINALARAAGRDIETIIASIRDASEMGGLPMEKPEGIVMHPPAWAVRLAKSKAPILFFDEITCVMPAGQAALLRIIHERVVGELKLPDNIWMLAAANPPEVAANGWELSPPMANRFAHLNWELSREAWEDGMITGFKDPKVDVLPDNWREGIPRARALVASFIHVKPSLLRAFPKTQADQGGPWPSPRSWDMAATVFAAAESVGADPYDLVRCCVGDGAALEFGQYVKNADLPDPMSMLNNPEEIQWTANRDDRAYAMLASVTAFVIGRNDPKLWERAFLVLESAVKANKKDLAAVSMPQLLKNQPKGATLPVKQVSLVYGILEAAKLTPNSKTK